MMESDLCKLESIHHRYLKKCILKKNSNTTLGQYTILKLYDKYHTCEVTIVGGGGSYAVYVAVLPRRITCVDASSSLQS